MPELTAPSVGILTRAPQLDPPPSRADRLRPVFEALSSAGITPEAVSYTGGTGPSVRSRLMALDAVLVWVDPITAGEDRTELDALLRDVAATGAWVSAHPDTILKMGTKEVLFMTRSLGWGGDIDLYRTLDDFEARLPGRLAAGDARVLKQQRGNGGIGVWKVEIADDAVNKPVVRVQHARDRETTSEMLPLDDFIERCAPYFDGGGCVVDQPFQPRISEGMVRCYFVGTDVVGFARQYADPTAAGDVLGLPSAKTMLPPDEPQFSRLRDSLESEWVPGMQKLVGIDEQALPALWDADLLYGPRDANGDDTYVLCEINVSCVTPFPPEAPAKIAALVASRLRKEVGARREP